MTAIEILRRMAAISPGLIDGQEDSLSGADVVDGLALLLGKADKKLRTKLEEIASQARKDEENENYD